MPPAKRIWAFYGQDMAFWNHYGELDLFTEKDQPTNVTRPTLVRYKGKIYPANRVHSAWVGFEEKGKPGLNQLLMSDFFQMWERHRADPQKAYPELARITDDNEDGVIEVNRPAEIDALLAATNAHLAATGFPLQDRRLVWVSDSRAYYSSAEWRDLQREEHEATAYASVYKFSHDVAPAKAALGAGGCTDCHRPDSPFFQGAVLDIPFSQVDAKPRWIPNFRLLGLSPFRVWLGAFRESVIKPLFYVCIGLLSVLFLITILGAAAMRTQYFPAPLVRKASVAACAAALVAGVVVVRTPDLLEYMTIRRFTLDANHFWIACGVLLAGLVTLLDESSHTRAGSPFASALHWCGWLALSLAGVSGALMLVKLSRFEKYTALSYTVFDISLLLSAVVTSILLFNRLRAQSLPTEHRRKGAPDKRTTTIE